MFTLTFRNLSRTAIAAGFVVISTGIFFTGSVEPAMALCKKGTPHCTPITRQEPPSVNGQQIPGSGWVDPDCENYPGLCDSSELKGVALKRKPSGPINQVPAGGPAKQ